MIMKKSSLGRRSSNAPRVLVSEFDHTRRERNSGIPRSTRATSADRNTSVFTPNVSSFGLVRSKSSSNLRATDGGRRLTSSGTERPSRLTSVSSSSVRTSSYGGSRTKRDNRPLQDKQWQAEAVGMVEDVIRRIPGGRELIPTGLRPLSIKIFVDVAGTLLSTLDSRIVLNNVNYITEIPFYAKLLQYRGKVDRSWLVSVNTSFAFPHALGLLHFLTTCYRAQGAVDPLSLMYPENFCSNNDTWNFKLVLPFLHESYHLYCEGCPNYEERQKELDRKLLQSHTADADNVLKEINSLKAKCEELKEVEFKKTAHIREMDNELNALKSSCTVKKKNLEELSEKEGSLEEKIKRLDTHIAMNNSQIASAGCNLQKVMNQVNTGASQSASLAELRKESASLEQNILVEKKYIELYEDKNFQKEVEINSLEKQLETSIRKIVSMLVEVLTDKQKDPPMILDVIKVQSEVGAIDKAFDGIKEIKLDCINSPETNYIAQIHELKSEISKLQTDNNSLNDKISTIKKEIDAARVQHDKRMLDMNTELSTLQEKRKQLEENIPEDVEELLKKRTIVAQEMATELKEYKKRTEFILSERARLFENHKKKFSEILRKNFSQKP